MGGLSQTFISVSFSFLFPISLLKPELHHSLPYRVTWPSGHPSGLELTVTHRPLYVCVYWLCFPIPHCVILVLLTALSVNLIYAWDPLALPTCDLVITAVWGRPPNLSQGVWLHVAPGDVVLDKLLAPQTGPRAPS